MPGQPFETDVSAEAYLLRVAASPTGRAYKALTLDQLRLAPGDTVIDLGCGPGTDLAAYAAVVGETGRVVGVDTDDVALSSARRRTAHLPQVQLRRGDVAALDLPAASADAVHTDRVLQHLPDPGAALRGAARTLRPGGRGVFAEPDWRTLVVDHPDPALAEAFTAYVVEHQVRSSRVGGELPRLCRSAGLEVEVVLPVTSVFAELEEADQVLGFRRVTQRAVHEGWLSAADARRWLEHLATEPVFASVTLFVVVATAPRVSPS